MLYSILQLRVLLLQALYFAQQLLLILFRLRLLPLDGCSTSLRSGFSNFLDAESKAFPQKKELLVEIFLDLSDRVFVELVFYIKELLRDARGSRRR